VVSLAVFFGGAYALVWLAEATEGDVSECDRGECGVLGELLDEHDLIALLVLALIAAVPAVLVWTGCGRFARRGAQRS
jgi:hypothetical protein